jgi:hypothetical protein
MEPPPPRKQQHSSPSGLNGGASHLARIIPLTPNEEPPVANAILCEGFASTWQTCLIKVAGEIITRARPVIVRLSSIWPHLEHFLAVSRAVILKPPGRSPP